MARIINTNTNTKYDIKCYFCSGNHACRDCPVEKSMSHVLKKKVGKMMEYFIADNLNCPECNYNELYVVGDNSPSLDIICSHCDNKFEVKSKCLSTNQLPNDIKLPHGLYNECINRIEEGLNLIVIIYGANRVNKSITIREILYANNTYLKNSRIIQVLKNPNNNLSTIFIKNKNYVSKLLLDTNICYLTFKNDIDIY